MAVTLSELAVRDGRIEYWGHCMSGSWRKNARHLGTSRFCRV